MVTKIFIPRSGSVYLYAFVAFGEFAALLIGLCLISKNPQIAFCGRANILAFLLVTVLFLRGCSGMWRIPNENCFPEWFYSDSNTIVVLFQMGTNKPSTLGVPPILRNHQMHPNLPQDVATSPRGQWTSWTGLPRYQSSLPLRIHQIWSTTTCHHQVTSTRWMGDTLPLWPYFSPILCSLNNVSESNVIYIYIYNMLLLLSVLFHANIHHTNIHYNIGNYIYIYI